MPSRTKGLGSLTPGSMAQDPSEPEVSDVVDIDAVQRAVPPRVVRAAKHEPIGRVRVHELVVAHRLELGNIDERRRDPAGSPNGFVGGIRIHRWWHGSRRVAVRLGEYRAQGRPARDLDRGDIVPRGRWR